MMMLPTTFDEAKEAIEYLKANGVPVVMRRIRPARQKNHPDSKFNEKGQLIEGPISPPFYDGIVTQLFKNDNPWYGGELDYYSKEEKEFLENAGV